MIEMMHVLIVIFALVAYAVQKKCTVLEKLVSELRAAMHSLSKN